MLYHWSNDIPIDAYPIVINIALINSNAVDVSNSRTPRGMRGASDSSEGVWCHAEWQTSQILGTAVTKQQTSQKREYCVMNKKQYKKQIVVKRKMLQKLFADICSNRFSAKIWRNVIFLETTFINYFKIRSNFIINSSVNIWLLSKSMILKRNVFLPWKEPPLLKRLFYPFFWKETWQSNMFCNMFQG